MRVQRAAAVAGPGPPTVGSRYAAAGSGVVPPSQQIRGMSSGDCSLFYLDSDLGNLWDIRFVVMNCSEWSSICTWLKRRVRIA